MNVYSIGRRLCSPKSNNNGGLQPGLILVSGLAALLARRDRALHRGDEIRIHVDELLARPAAVQLVAGLARGAHEQAGSAVEVSRRAAAPPFAVVGHRYAKGSVSGVDSTLRPVDREINCAISTANRRPRAATETGCRCAESRSRV